MGHQLVVDIQDFSLTFDSPEGTVEAVRNVSLSLSAGEIVALVGESGCGKSTLCRSIVKLLSRTATKVSGKIFVKGREIDSLSDQELRTIRGMDVGMVFQNPVCTLNPVLTIGAQLREALVRKYPTESKENLNKRALELLQTVGMECSEERLAMVPAHFSGGEQQRITLAIALAAKPAIILADEPTTALDVTVQIHLLNVLKELAKKEKIAILLVTHDMAVASYVADRIGIMYAGSIVEVGTTKEIFYYPQHPYTWGLLGTIPTMEGNEERLVTIPGMPPNSTRPIVGDAFADRNEYALAIDYLETPPIVELSPTHRVATWLLDKRAPKIDIPLYIQRRHDYFLKDIQHEK